MSEKILLQILAEVKDLRTDVNGMKAQLDENTQIIKVICDSQDETDNKPTNLSSDIQGMKNNLATLTKIVAELQTDLAFTLHKAYTNEKEIFFFHRQKFNNKTS